MCQIIVINKGEKEIQTPKEFLEHFKFIPQIDSFHQTIDMECCLCQCDLEKSFKDNSIDFKKDCGDYYVGMLDQITF